MDDNELSAMQSVLAALQPLDGPEQARVLRWAWERFGDGVEAIGGGAQSEAPKQAGQPEFTDVGEVVEAAAASTGPERALCVAYFIQEVSGRPGFAGQEVNSALKNLGHPLANVTKTLSNLRAQRPSLVMQVNKSGRSRQARKTYRLTSAGVDEVRKMFRRGSERSTE
ncbi:MAG: hypothetical protein ACRDKT_05540 [Actinomycetota bacterium]